MPYLIMKLLHVLFVILFVGNIIISIFWKMHGDKTKDPKIIAHTLKGIIKSDRIFTHVGITGILIFGFGAQGIGGLSIMTGWIIWSIIMIVISGFAFFAKVIPIQKRMLALAESSDFDLRDYSNLSRRWAIWGLIATITPLIAVAFMVLKIPY